jgi:MinD superfamily P-loop ATPase
MRIAVTGGKGGTGKSTVATSVAYEMAKHVKTLLVDCDVECPDDHLLLSISRQKVMDVETLLPSFDQETCQKCGTCSRVCRQNAIVFVTGEYPFLIPEQCNGCGACILACPAGSITEDSQVIGTIYQGKIETREGSTETEIAENFLLISGEVEVGCEASTLVVNATRKYASQLEEDYPITVIDTAAGTHCNVIAALMDTNLVLAVSEPTPLGKHDLGLILELLEKIGLEAKIIINRADLGKLDLIKVLAGEMGLEVVLEIPYQKRILENYSRGVPALGDLVSQFVVDMVEETRLEQSTAEENQ